jgi:hypothetical protein
MQFPIDLEQYDRREQLKKSGLGKVRNERCKNHSYLLLLGYRRNNFDQLTILLGRSLCFYQNLMRKPHPTENLRRIWLING